MSLKWIAQRLQMGPWTYVSTLLNEKPEPQRLRRCCPCVNSEDTLLETSKGNLRPKF